MTNTNSVGLQPNIIGYEESFVLSSRFWFLVLVTGIGAGLEGAALMGLLRLGQHLAWSYSSGDFLNAVSRSTMEHRIDVLLGTGFFVAGTGYLLRRPTGGSGTELAAAIWFKSGEMPFFRSILKAVISILVVAFGASLGREGAPKQVGAAWANLLAKWGRIPSPQQRLLVACGAGAGLAAVYNVPMGGALFAVEILLGTLSLTLVLPAMAASMIAVAVSWLFLPNRPTYSFPIYPTTASALAGAVLVGLLAGLASGRYVAAVAWIDARKPRGALLLLAPVLFFLALGAASIIYPQLLGNGKDVVQLAFRDHMGWPLLATLLLLRPLATLGCLASGAPGGLFTPTLTLGALLGGLFGHFWNNFLPGENPAAYAILGAGAFLGASMKGPLTALVLMLELTDHVASLFVPLILAVTLATLIARTLDERSIYSCRVHLGKRAARRDPGSKEPFVFDESRMVSAALPYGELLKRLLSPEMRDLSLYVVDEKGRLLGEVSAARAAGADRFASPLEAATAGDLTTPAHALLSSLSPDAMDRELDAQHVTHLPVTEASSGRFLGFHWRSPRHHEQMR